VGSFRFQSFSEKFQVSEFQSFKFEVERVFKRQIHFAFYLGIVADRRKLLTHLKL